MTVMELGAIGEFVGSIAVIGTLIYLALQIRQNTFQMKEAANQASMKEWGNWRAQLIENRDVAEILVKGYEDPSSLDPTDFLRFRESILTLIGAIWAQEQRIRDGSMEFEDSVIDEWLERLMIRAPGVVSLWGEIKHGYPPRFQQRVANAIQRVKTGDET